ncbi:unnamed protein product [Boreogadus saida]
MLRLNCRAASIAIFRHHYPHWRLLCGSFRGILFRHHYPHWRLLCRSFHGILFRWTRDGEDIVLHEASTAKDKFELRKFLQADFVDQQTSSLGGGNSAAARQLSYGSTIPFSAGLLPSSPPAGAAGLPAVRRRRHTGERDCNPGAAVEAVKPQPMLRWQSASSSGWTPGAELPKLADKELQESANCNNPFSSMLWFSLKAHWSMGSSSFALKLQKHQKQRILKGLKPRGIASSAMPTFGLNNCDLNDFEELWEKSMSLNPANSLSKQTTRSSE